MKNISALLMLFLLASMLACSHQPVPLASEPAKVYCPPPPRPTVQMLSKDASAQANIEQALRNANAIVDYTLKLESTLKCYEEALKK